MSEVSPVEKTLAAKQRKILIVDDEPFNLRVLKLKFENAGYKVFLAGNGKEGLERFAQEGPDVVVTDINMPIMDGREMCRRLPPPGDYLLLVMTSSLENEVRSWTHNIAGIAFVQKPISPRQLLEKANKYLEGQKESEVASKSDFKIEDHVNGHKQVSPPQSSKNGFRLPENTQGQTLEKVPVPASELAEKDIIAQELATRYEELDLIYRIGKRLRLDAKVETSLSDLMEDSARGIDADACIISLNSRHVVLKKKFLYDDAVTLAESTLSRLEKVITERLQKSREPFTVQETNVIPALKDLPPMRLMVGPIDFESTREKGYMAYFRKSTHRTFSTGDMRLLSVLTGHASIITTNHDLYQDLKQVLFSVVQSLSDTIEAKDAYTRGHTERVSGTAVALGKAMNFKESQLEHIRWAGVLHDIGKIGIPGEIIAKPGRLTDAEMEIMKEHPTIGYQILEHIEALREALPGVLHHHEKYDGSGYPHGLAGHKIPLYARLISVADTYDSITSSRPYRKAKSHEFAMEIMTQVAGSQLDPEIFTLFKELIENDAALRSAQKHAKH